MTLTLSQEELDQITLVSNGQRVIKALKPFIPQDVKINNITYEVYRLTYNGRRHGDAWTRLNGSEGKVRIDDTFLEPGMEQELYDLMAHEISHIIGHRMAFKAGYKDGDGNHGYYWGYCMIALGYRPERYSSMDSAKKVRGSRKARKMVSTRFETCSGCSEVTLQNLDSDDMKRPFYKCQDCGYKDYV
jgi:predicted SprT family Zn-dependent metalloprotease